MGNKLPPTVATAVEVFEKANEGIETVYEYVVRMAPSERLKMESEIHGHAMSLSMARLHVTELASEAGYLGFTITKVTRQLVDEGRK